MARDSRGYDDGTSGKLSSSPKVPVDERKVEPTQPEPLKVGPQGHQPSMSEAAAYERDPNDAWVGHTDTELDIREDPGFGAGEVGDQVASPVGSLAEWQAGPKDPLPGDTGPYEGAKLGEVAGTAPDTSLDGGTVAAKPGVAGSAPDTSFGAGDTALASQLTGPSLEGVLDQGTIVEQGTIVDGPVDLAGAHDLAAEATFGREQSGWGNVGIDRPSQETDLGRDDTDLAGL